MHIINVGMVEIFPVIGVFFYFRHQALHRFLKKANTLKDTHDILQTPVTFIGESEKDRITLELQQILFVEADDNYVIIHYFESDQLKKYMMRSSLSSIESADYPIDFLLRIHRSFLVNAFLVVSISGNVHKSELKLRHIDNLFPVSRTHITAVRSRLADI
jgi:DNA-binding LytR/AlgR family response regulator